MKPCANASHRSSSRSTKWTGWSRGLLRDLLEHRHGVVIAITTDAERWRATLDGRLQSRIGDLRPLSVDRYDTETLADVFSPRADRALVGGVGQPEDGGAISQARLRHIADAAAGNAHDGLSILRQAVQAAAERGQ